MKPTNSRRDMTRPVAFTLVELLVVITIIALLVGILLPSFGVVRNNAKATATGAMVNNTLRTGLEEYRSEQRLGDDYPPSYWDTQANGNPYKGANQPTLSDTNYASDFNATGAQTLAWALAGADGLNTPGFSGNTLDKLYDLDNTQKPMVTRYGPYLDLSKAKLKKYASPENVGSWKYNSYVPVILDDFGKPILYFKAHTSQELQAAPYGLSSAQADLLINKYRLEDNRALLDWVPSDLEVSDPLADTASSVTFKDGVSRAPFFGFIRNAKSTVDQPNNVDSFILISAGIDGLYGTPDDITNFNLDERANTR